MDKIKNLLASYTQAAICYGEYKSKDNLKEEKETRSALLLEIHTSLQAAQPQWQPIETAPKDGKTEIDLWISSFGRLAGCVWHIGSFDNTSSGHWGFKKYHNLTQRLPQEFTPTHWMPLPLPPQQ